MIFLRVKGLEGKGFELFHRIREHLTPKEELALLHLLFKLVGLTQSDDESPQLFGDRVRILALD